MGRNSQRQSFANVNLLVRHFVVRCGNPKDGATPGLDFNEESKLEFFLIREILKN